MKPQKRFRRILIVGIAGLLVLCTVAVSISALSNLGLPTSSQVVDRLDGSEKARLAEVFHLRQTVGDSVWPGWGQADIPVILYNEEFAFLVGYPDPPSGWVKVPDGDTQGGSWEPVPNDTFEGQPYYRQQLPDPNITPEAFAVLVGERWVASLQTKEWTEIALMNQLREDLPPLLEQVFPYRLANRLLLGSSDKFISLVQHESFHAYQGIVAPDRLEAAEVAAKVSEGRYPWEDTALQGSWQVELDLLAEAVQSMSDDEAAELARQFLAHRQERRDGHKLGPDLVNYERQREWLEGLAKYVELAVWREAATAPGYEPLLQKDALPDFEDYTTFESHWSQEVAQIKRMAGDRGDGRFYYSGMAQAFLLDRLMPDWKARALTEDVWLETLLGQAVQQH